MLVHNWRRDLLEAWQGVCAIDQPDEVQQPGRMRDRLAVDFGFFFAPISAYDILLLQDAFRDGAECQSLNENREHHNEIGRRKKDWLPFALRER